VAVVIEILLAVVVVLKSPALVSTATVVITVVSVGKLCLCVVLLGARTSSVLVRAPAEVLGANGVINQVLPSRGQQGTSVTLSGSNLLGSSSGLESVTLAGVLASFTASMTPSKVVVVAGLGTEPLQLLREDYGLNYNLQL